MLILFKVILICNYSLSAYEIESILFLNDQNQIVEHKDFEKLTKLRAGHILDTTILLEDINALKKSFPKYSDIIATVNPGQNEYSIALNFEFQLKRKVQRVRVKLDGVEDDIDLDLRSELQTQRGTILKGTSIDYDKDLIRKRYTQRGYLDLEITHDIEANIYNHDVIVHYYVKSHEGRTLISDITFSGNHSIKDSKLKKKIKSKESGFFSKYILEEKKVIQDVRELLTYYRNNGFLEAEISYEIKNDEDSYKSINFSIIENTQSIIKKVEFVGTEIFKENEIEKVLSIKEGSPYSEKNLRIGLQKVREFYGKSGHIMVDIISDYNPESETLTILLSEGEAYSIDDILVTGMNKMKEETILLDVTLVQNELVNIQDINESLSKMRQTGYYDDVKIDFSPTHSNSGNIIIQVQEASTQMIEFGVGYSSLGLGGDIGYRNSNLFNAGKAISFKASKAQELLKLGMVYSDPHLLGTDYEMDISANVETGKRSNYEKDSLSLSAMVSKQITKNIKLGIGTRVEFLNIAEVSDQLANEVYDATGNRRTIGMMSTFVYKEEQYDSTGEAISGKRMKLALLPSYSEEGVYNKVVSEFITQKSFASNSNGSHHIISSRVTLGYSSENTPYYEKFYAGGTGSLRGYKNNSISSDGSAAGGNYSLSANVNYSFPIWKDFLKGVAFVEAASVSNELSELDDVRVVAGLGVRANLRNTFLRNNIEAGFALPVNAKSRDEDILRPFYFMLGSYDPAYDL
ncbi:outer membrane protein assembly factor [Halobacteriovorax sp. HLS]|uniref:BamA/OMP85 family outer membrane protein n=1 Tax=Halobacteriovorax sp. HLS TaxID=2234000 RepID=UPI0013E3A9B8|nr:POTRA domain-containing protein [Halobacteriovorax sp. HLS]